MQHQNGEESLFLKSSAASLITPFQNGEYFIRMDKPSYKYFIYNTDGFQIIDSLEGNFDSLDSRSGRISMDNHYFVTYVNHGNNLAVWDVQSRKMISKINDKDTTLRNARKFQMEFSADNSKIFTYLSKTYNKG